MRIAAGLILLASLAFAQDNDDHDEYGFPITFDADVITRNDVLRSAGVDSEEALGSMRNERDKFLMERLLEKLAEMYGLEITVREVDDWIAREIARHDSEAEFYDSLLQEGLTLELKKQDIRRKLLEANMMRLFQTGFIAGGQKLLPWDPSPTPREIRIAYDNDPARKNQGVDVQWQDLVIDITKKERAKINLKRAMDPDISEQMVQKQIREKVEPLVAKVRERLKAGKSLEQIAGEFKLDFKRKERSLSKELSEQPAIRFLQTGEAGKTSEPVALPNSRWVVLKILQVARPDDLKLTDSRVVAAYRQKISMLKQTKAEFALRLRALDKADLRPERVRQEMRDLLLTTLKQTRRELRTLGIH